jgi:ABC-type sugar transport system ATPase subunit
MSKETPPLLHCQTLSKSFSGVQALNGVDFQIDRGSIHGLVGENGAGKSTLAKLMAGVHRPDAGTIELDGKRVHFHSPEDAILNGVVTIHQDINLIPTLSVLDNIMLNHELVLWQSGIIHKRKEKSKVLRLLQDFGIDVDPESIVSSLPNDLKKMIQIIKAVSLEHKILLMDEPTSALTDVQARYVLDLMVNISKRGVGLVFISHYIGEIFKVCDVVTILRDGKRISEKTIADTTLEEVVSDMLGKTGPAEAVKKHTNTYGKVLLSVRNLSVKGHLKSVSFDLHEGEVLGITGLTGSGTSEIGKGIFGAEDVQRESGFFEISGKSAKLRNPTESLLRGIALLSGDRVNEGVLSDFSIRENICLPILSRYARGLRGVDEPAMKATAQRVVDTLNIRTRSVDTPVKLLSGGNQQKVVVGKWLETKPRLFILDEPTQGIDIGSKSEIRELVRSIARAGVGIILITNELEEIEQLCDRVIVLFRGSIVKEFGGSEISGEAILRTSIRGG